MNQARTFQLVQGVWNPRDKKFSWVVADEFDDMEAARRAFDGTAGIGRGGGGRLSYAGPPYAIVQVNSKVVDRIGGQSAEQGIET